LRAVVAAGLLAGAFGGAQQAAAIAVVPGITYLDLIDDKGVANDLVILPAGPGELRVSDTAGVTFDPGSKCKLETPQQALCDVGPDGRFYGQGMIALDAGDDRLTMLASWPRSIPPFVRAGEGNDVLVGFSGEDDFRGGPGDDLLAGGGGSDLLRAGLGDDACYGGPGSDSCQLGAGVDLCETGSGADSCFGKAGNDLCMLGGGNDSCHAGRGRDRCDGGGGRDTTVDCEHNRGFEVSRPIEKQVDRTNRSNG